MTTEYPKKYWWLILVVVPLVGGVIAVAPNFFKKSGGGSDSNSIVISGSNVDGDVKIIGTQVIYNEIKDQVSDKQLLESIKTEINKAVNLSKGSFYKDAIAVYEKVSNQVNSPTVLNNLASLYLLENNLQAARDKIKQGIALDANNQQLRVNLAQVYLKEGDYSRAINQLKQAPDDESAKELLSNLETMAQGNNIEHEPNNTILEPNILPLTETVSGSLIGERDADFYQIKTPKEPRDIFKVELVNHSIQLQPQLHIWTHNKEHILQTSQYLHDITAGQDLQLTFSPNANEVYYVSVNNVAGEGKYDLKLTPTKASDNYEPNENIPAAKSIDAGDSIAANIMDKWDKDFYLLKSNAESMTVQITNESLTLKPSISIWNADKSFLQSSSEYPHQVTNGQNVSMQFNAKPNQNYYISVSGFDTAGKYQLKVDPSSASN